MRKLWMGCAAAVISCMLAAWAPRSADPSQHLLAKAQSEFAERARDSVYQRGIVPGVSQHVTAAPMVRVAVSDHAMAAPAESTGSDTAISAAVSAAAPDAAVTAVNVTTNEQSDSVSAKQVASADTELQPLLREAAVLPVSSLARPKAAPTKIARYAVRQPAGRKTRRHSEPNAAAVQRSINMLRSRAPEIAALVARYM